MPLVAPAIASEGKANTAGPRPVMRELLPPSRPYRLGNPRRQPEGASRPAGGRPPSLDTSKQVATTVRKWLEAQENESDKFQKRVHLWQQLKDTVYSIWQDYAHRPKDTLEQAWINAYDEEKAKVYADQSPDYNAWLEAHVKAWLAFNKKPEFPAVSETYLRVLYLEAWKKKNKPVGINRQILKWEKQYFQLLKCHGEWVAYRATCCEEKTEVHAVPVGCNHRLCPLCSWHRSQNAFKRTRALFDRLTHPQFITLTTPNIRAIDKGTLHNYRKKVRALMAIHAQMFNGGVYAIETTYNRREKSWHVHAHVLVDASYALPSSDWKIDFAGRQMRAFDYIKHVIEFDWTRLWSKKVKDRFGSLPRKNACRGAITGERFAFECWLRERFENRTRRFDANRREWKPMPRLSASELRRREEWNRENRRVVWIKPVDDRNRAAKEVLKYITKCSDFADLAACVEEFHNATKGARLIQTFGSWYGVKLDVAPNHNHPEDWAQLKCACGQNLWARMGLFLRHDVEMRGDGRCVLTREFNCRSAGTVARPTIRALEDRENLEEFSYGFNRDHDAA
jgi:Replication protein/Transposase zinc-binding domain